MLDIAGTAAIAGAAGAVVGHFVGQAAAAAGRDDESSDDGGVRGEDMEVRI